MGFLSEGKALPWEEAKEYADFIRQEGIKQFLAIYNRVKSRCCDELMWGDEIEYVMIEVDHEKKTARLSLRAPEVLAELMKDEQSSKTPKTCWRPEYGSFMLESLPGTPYLSHDEDLLRVQRNMELRRAVAKAQLKPNERVMALTSYPMMGVGNFTSPPPPKDWTPGSDKYAASIFIQDQIINPHPRFGTLSANIRKRKTDTVDINVPLFKDTNTGPPQYGTEHQYNLSGPSTPVKGALPDSIYMDAMAFGMGCCCLQCTFQCKDINEARHYYDQLATLTPIMMAISAAAPIFRGYLADTDVRWNVISSSVDDRTPEERGTAELKTAKFGRIPKSRYDSISLYISKENYLKPEYNDLETVPINQEAYNELIEAGIDEKLARHIAHLFIRDPLVIYENRIKIDHETNSDHFENIQSTNWQTVRFKPPPPNSTIGWRVEFRSIEAQLTEFENAAFAVFVILLTRALSDSNLNLYLPLSKVDENMKRAHQRDAVKQQKFYFRESVQPDSADSFREMTADEIINGKEGGFPGVSTFILKYINASSMSDEIKQVVKKYISFVGKRASGEFLTTATWMRNFVMKHPDYKHDSVVSHKINYDLLEACHQIAEGILEVPELLPPLVDRKLPEWFVSDGTARL